MIKQEKQKRLLLPLDENQGWNENLIDEATQLISKLSATEVISGLTTLTMHSPPKKGRPKTYNTAWLKLENSLVSFEDFKTLIYNQLIEGDIGKDTYYRAIRKAKEFIKHRERLNIKPQTYSEAWVSLQQSKINFEEFKEILKQLFDEKKITEEKYRHALRRGNELVKIRKSMIELSRTQG